MLLDIHLSELYDVETRALKQAVRRNKHRFPSDFMFTLKDAEIKEAVANGFIPSVAHLGGAKPFAFTEGGVAMLSSVLNSKRAIAMNPASSAGQALPSCVPSSRCAGWPRITRRS